MTSPPPVSRNPLPSAPAPSLDQDLVSSLPAPVLRLLVLFAGPIAWLKDALEILTWKKGRAVESWIVLGIWWAVCLGGTPTFRFLFPLVIFVPLLPIPDLRIPFLAKRGQPPATSRTVSHSPSNPSTPHSLLLTLSDLHAIHARLPHSLPARLENLRERWRGLGLWRLTRGLVVSTAVWIILGWWLTPKVQAGIVGTIILLLPSPGMAHMLVILSKSLFVRRAIALIFILTFGSPPATTEGSPKLTIANLTLVSPWSWAKAKWQTSRRPSVAFSFRPRPLTKKGLNSSKLSGSAIAEDDWHEGISASSKKGSGGLDVPKPAPPVYFRFEVQENQRWWMGLDWTSALLPQERSSWCDSHLLPVSPPATFSLPKSSTVILPHPTKKDPNGKVKRTAIWRWIDDDWSIVRKPQGGDGSATTTAQGNKRDSRSYSTSSREDDGPAQASGSSGTGFTLGSQASQIISGSGAVAPPSHEETGIQKTASLAEQAFVKGLERLKGKTGSPMPAVQGEHMLQAAGFGISSSPTKITSQRMTQQTETRERRDSRVSEQGDALGGNPLVIEVDDVTDADGWVYGDNKWENMGAKGGLGKFTRRRRWTRRAICIESVEYVPSLAGVASPIKVKPPPLPIPAAVPLPLPIPKAMPVVSTTAVGGTEVKAEERNAALRQRLKNAMGNVGG